MSTLVTKPPFIAAAVLLMFGVAAQAQTYNSSTKQLTIPQVRVDSAATFTNVVLRLDSFFVLAATGPVVTVSGGFTSVCTAANFTLERFNAINAGMPIDQVKNTIGCDVVSERQLTNRVLTWKQPDDAAGNEIGNQIEVQFDAATALVAPRFRFSGFPGALKSLR